MKAIQTEYNGILFRSRLEARWAVLFDALKLEYIYEPECYTLENGLKYTPDFYLPKYDLNVEIKPNFDWMNDKYHFGRYKLFQKQLLVLSGSYPNFNVNVEVDLYEQNGCGVIFCPNRKYEPFYFAGDELGSNVDLFDYSKELEIVKQHRFWN